MVTELPTSVSARKRAHIIMAEKRNIAAARVKQTKTTAETATKAQPPAPAKREKRVKSAAATAPVAATAAKAPKASTKAAPEPKKTETKTATPAAPKRERRGTAVVEPVKADRTQTPKTLNRIYSTLVMLDEFGPGITGELAEMLKEQCFPEIDTHKVRLAFVRKPIRRVVKSADKEIAGTAWTLNEGDLVFVHSEGASVHVYNTLTKQPIEAIFDAKAATALKYDVVPTDEKDFDLFLRTEAGVLEAAGIRVDWAS